MLSKVISKYLSAIINVNSHILKNIKEKCDAFDIFTVIKSTAPGWTLLTSTSAKGKLAEKPGRKVTGLRGPLISGARTAELPEDQA